MEDTEFKDLKWEDCLPIPYGWLKALARILLLAIFCAFMLLSVRLLPGDIGSLFRVVAFLAVAFWVMLMPSKTYFFGQYWTRNVRGYVLWVCPHGSEDIEYSLRPRGKVASVSSHSILGVVLGGWFHKLPSRVNPWCTWKIKLIDTTPDKELSSIRFTDEHGSSIILTVASAAKILHALVLMWKHSIVVFHWSFAVPFLLHEKEKSAGQVTTAQEIILEAINRLGQTTRFIRSKEAERIREWLTQELVDHLLSSHDPRREALIKQMKNKGAQPDAPAPTT